ncbi:alginate lyase family protein [Colwellia sp. Arc7-635]|nr:alginate lyase family protein [Colwellia sp. Arc7-635]
MRDLVLAMSLFLYRQFTLQTTIYLKVGFMAKLSIYFHTLKYLKFTQVYHRILKKLVHPKIHHVEGIQALTNENWVRQELCSQKFLNESDVLFLNHQGSVDSPNDWNNDKEEKLWLYNLHYFDDLTSFDSHSRKELQLFWINKWVDENPANDAGNGWESYTLSLRIVNWTKAFLSGLDTSEKMLNSLAQQADFLSQDLEKHLLGNHYFVNLKALMFAGCYFEGEEADKWLAIALKGYESELKEQVLSDGGSFELTPMYHAIMLTDLLDLINLFESYPSRVPADVIELTKQTIVKMFGWLHIMSHGDDKVSFFNDSTFGIAPENATLREYATKLGFAVNEQVTPTDALIVHNMQNTGYVSVKTAEMNLIADLAPVGPSYIPGHAHADSLSFELSLGQSRVFVNSGTSLYGMSSERLRQRGTSAHNTVEINKQNSSQVWSGFRVAKRADIGNRSVGKVTTGKNVQFSAAHNGYKKQGMKCIHHRTWNVSIFTCEIKDVIQGDFDSAFGYLHLHPDIEVVSNSPTDCTLKSTNHEIKVEVSGASLTVEDSTWHPEFGVVISNKKLRLEYKKSQVTYRINWKAL